MRAQPARRRLVTANLLRVCRYLAATGMANDATAAAARDGKALAGLVREAFGNYVRGYLEVAILPVYGRAQNRDRMSADDEASAMEAFPPGRRGPLILVSMHFGAIEIPGLWATTHLGVPMTAPMETLDDPHLQQYMLQTRAETGLTVVPLEGAARELRTTIGRGETVALVADRPIGGSGTRVELFGAPARLPAGPAVLALETGAPTWLVATRRTGWGNYRTRLERIEMPDNGTRRERLQAFLDAEARAFERAVADAPGQWWTLFFPIWQPSRGDDG